MSKRALALQHVLHTDSVRTLALPLATMQCLLFLLAAFLQLCATDPFSIRLSGSPNLCIGRVEVFHRGKWGMVCDDEWDMLDATVVCRELDCGEALSAPHGAWFGEGTGPIWLNEVRCQGTEQHLHACRHRGFRKHICTHEEDASAICSVQRFPFPPFTAFSPPPTVKEDKMEAVMTTRPVPSVPAEGSPALRLIGGRSRCSGRVEVFHEGQWGTVCDDMWGLSDAAVVCQQLGCGEALAAPGSAIFGEGNDVIWLDDVQCQGGESTLTECLTSPWGTHNCRHNEDAGVVCSDEMPLTMVEEHLAILAMTMATQRPQPISSRRSPRPTLPTRYQAESVAHEASWHTGKSSMEGHSEAILAGQWQVRLAGGSGSCAGRVEVLHEDSWGTVCDDSWDLLDAAVVCRELHCGAPLLSPGNARYGPGTGPIWLDDVNCMGKESTLQHCQSQPWGQHNCNHHEDASVICTGTWKPLSLPKPVTDSSIAELILTTRGPEPADESGLQNTLDVAEVPTQSLPPPWEMEFPNPWHPDEIFLPPTNEMELEVKKEAPTSHWNIQEMTPGQEVLQDVHDIESLSALKTRLPAHTHGPEPTDPSVNSQPLSTMWDLKSERETEPPSPPGTVMHTHGLQATVEGVPSIQWNNMSQEPTVTQKAEASNSSSETQPATAIWVAESERETEPTSFSGTELLPDTQLAMETVTQVQWDDTTRMPPVTQEPTNTPAESQPASTMWVWESEKETKSAIHGGMELFLPSKSMEATREMEMQTATQNIQPMNDREETSPRVPDLKGSSDPKQKEILNKDHHSVRPIAETKSTIVPSASDSWDGTDVNDVISQSPVLHAFDIGSPSEKGLSSEVTERDSDAASTLGQTKTSGTSTPFTEPAILPTQLSESSAGCPVRQEPRKQHQDCCCSADALGNIVHAMDGLREELGSLSTAIQQQGSQLEALAHNLAELVTSVHQLVRVLPTLMQPVPSSPSSVPCRQNEGEIQNQPPIQ
ncbi:soluble scavenger receptor cysteine-rich domain-containing protein SSC5D-like [Heteronotia binoei]|uniref:soluble scavenger receptor cysteine-rich domain-containing protein SSC5D-like n=1 Tax=Heteronotia binoei TaxID=13085 RepID=UPI00292E80D0|nr:soluble scavenger receptor cysteine-rich domain-containing protein SSC5D-like [Heteronotia binoei]